MKMNHQALSGKKVAPYVIPTGGVSMPPALGPLTSGLACHLPSYAANRPTRRGNSAWATPQRAGLLSHAPRLVDSMLFPIFP